jgi:hypothetical protein
MMPKGAAEHSDVLTRNFLVSTALNHGAVLELLHGVRAFKGSVLLGAVAWVVLDCELHFPVSVFGSHVLWVAHHEYRRNVAGRLVTAASAWTCVGKYDDGIRCILCLICIKHEPLPSRTHEPVLRRVCGNGLPSMMKLREDAAVALYICFALRQPSAETGLEFASCSFILASVEVLTAIGEAENGGPRISASKGSS